MSKRTEDHRRRQQIVDALVSIINIYPQKETFLFPILDTLLLYPQKPRIISVYADNSEAHDPIYTSMQDPELSSIFKEKLRHGELSTASCIKVPNTKYYFCLHQFDASKDMKTVTFSPIDGDELKGFRSIFNKLNSKETDSGRVVLEFITERIQEVQLRKQQAVAAPGTDQSITANLEGGAIDISEEEIWELLAPMRRVLDDALADFLESPLIDKLNRRDLPFPNIFCVVQTKISSPRRTHFDYTARVLLSYIQKERIGGACGQDYCDHLEYPLGPSVRSIADSVFASGIIDFSSEGPGEGRDRGGSKSAKSPDSLRRVAEKCVYGRIASDPKVFYIPVHIGGVPWLSLFTLTEMLGGEEAQTLSWTHNYGLYVTLIPRINNRVRAGVKRLYINLLGDRLADELMYSDGSNLFGRINRTWKRVAYVYPHKVAVLVPADKGKGDFELPDGSWARLELNDNPYYTRQIQIEHDFLDGDRQHILDECKKAIDRAKAKQSEVDRRFVAEVLSQRHTVFNRIPDDQLRNALTSPADELSGEARVHVADASRMTDVLNVSLWIGLRKQGDHPLRNEKSVLRLLRWLAERTLTSEAKPVLEIGGDGSDVPLPDEQLSAAFTVLWNLWHNASKKHPSSAGKSFTVKAVKRNSTLEIVFRNEGSMVRPWADYLLGKGPCPNKLPEPRGLQIVLEEQLPQLGWQISGVEVGNGHTQITLRIPDTSSYGV
jgi:hypothetical protein